MSNLTTVSDATFDTAAAAVPGPFGPLTRVGSLDALPRTVPNSEQDIAVTGQGGVAFDISYNDLIRPDVRDKIIANAYGVRSALKDIKDFAEMLYRTLETINVVSATKQDYQDTIRMFQFVPQIMGLVPFTPNLDISLSNKAVANFTMSGSGLTRSFVNTSTGEILEYVWNFGDGTFSTLEDPAPKTWTAGTYTVTLKVIGPGGISTKATSVTVS